MTTNPLFFESSLPYHVPDFPNIRVEHFEPAITAGLAQHQKEIEEIANQSAPATFENTVEALERSGELLSRVMTAFHTLNSSKTSLELQALQREFAPRLSAHHDSVYLNDSLYQRVKAVKQSMGSELLEEQLRLLDHTLLSFEISGSHLEAAMKEELKAVNQRLATLQTDFSNAMLKARLSCWNLSSPTY